MSIRGKPTVARRIRARYAFEGPGVEIDKTLPLEADEAPILQGRVSVASRLPMFGGLGYVRLSSLRLCVNRHHAVSPDRIIEIRKPAFVDSQVEAVGWMAGPRTGRWRLRLTFLTDHGEDSVLLAALGALHTGADTRGDFKATLEDHFGGVRADPIEQLADALKSWRDIP